MLYRRAGKGSRVMRSPRLASMWLVAAEGPVGEWVGEAESRETATTRWRCAAECCWTKGPAERVEGNKGKRREQRSGASRFEEAGQGYKGRVAGREEHHRMPAPPGHTCVWCTRPLSALVAPPVARRRPWYSVRYFGRRGGVAFLAGSRRGGGAPCAHKQREHDRQSAPTAVTSSVTLPVWLYLLLP